MFQIRKTILKDLHQNRTKNDIEGLKTLKYDFRKLEKTYLFTRIYIDYNQEQIMKANNLN